MLPQGPTCGPRREPLAWGNQTSQQNWKRHRAEFKARLVVAVLCEHKPLNQLGAEHGVHPLVISG